MKTLEGLTEAAGVTKEFSQVQIIELQKIIKILNRYYNSFNKEKSVSQSFRELVEQTQPENLKIEVRKFGNYEYLISAEIVNRGKDSWIHMDGISQERDELRKREILNHPVFSIVSLGDIFDM
jgi:hypothetical protein